MTDARHPPTAQARRGFDGLARLWTAQWVLPFAFLALCAPLGIFLAVETSPGQVADEIGHIAKAQSVLDGQWLGRRETIDTSAGKRLQQGVDAEPGVMVVASEPSPALVTTEHWNALGAIPWGKRAFLAIGTIAGYWPGFYVPAALALGLAKAAGASPLYAFLSARVANLVVYLAMATAALAMARRARALLFCSLSMPMALSLGASVNQDGLVIAASALGIALLTRPRASGPSFVRREGARIGAALLLVAVVLAKPPYLPLAGLLLLPLPRLADGSSWAGRIALVALVAVAAVGWTWVTVHFVATPVLRPPEMAGPLWPGPRPAEFPGTDMAAQMSVLMAKPVRFLTLPWESIRHDDFMLEEAIGVLAYLSLFLPAWLYAVWKVALVSAAAADTVERRDDAEVLPVWQAPIPLLCALTALIAIYLAQYLSWTTVGDRHIVGPQGRYWLPLFPAVAFALPSLWRPTALGAALTAMPLLACAADLFAVPGVVIRYFYMH